MGTLFSGNLRETSFARLLVDLKANNATGTLLVKTAAFIKTVYFKNGSAVFASSTLDDDRLGEMLVKAGRITIRQYENSVEILKNTGKRQGAILVDLGYITPKDLFWGVKFQVKEIITGLFLIEDATYEFLDGELPSEEVITLRISTENLVYEGVKQITNWTRIRKELPDPEAVFAVAAPYRSVPLEQFHTIDLSAEDRRILSLVDGGKTIRQLVEETRINSFEVMKTLYVLWTVGVITAEEGVRTEGTVDIEEMVTQGPEEARIVPEVDPALRQRIEEFYYALDRMRPDEILQVSGQTAVDEIKRSYHRLAREFHPDILYNAEDRVLKEKIAVVFDSITKAYRLFQDDSRRYEYFRSLEKGSDAWMSAVGGLSGDQDTRESLITEQFRRGVEEFKHADFWSAAELFGWVVKEEPRNAKAWSYLSLSLSKLPQRLKEAEEALLEAIRLEPFNSDHATNLGLIYLKAGLRLRARHQFEKAFKLDPHNERAKTGLEQTS